MRRGPARRRYPRHRRRSETPQRVGYWIAALEHGRGATRTLLYGNGVEPVTVMPRFWSEQNGLRIRVCGRIDPVPLWRSASSGPVVATPHARGVLATYYLDGTAVGVVVVNAPHAFTIAARALQANVVMTPTPLRPAAPRQAMSESARSGIAV